MCLVTEDKAQKEVGGGGGGRGEGEDPCFVCLVGCCCCLVFWFCLLTFHSSDLLVLFVPL